MNATQPGDPAERVRLLAMELADAMVALASSAAAPSTEPEQLYSLKQVAQRTSLSRSMVGRLVRHGDIESLTVGNRYLVKASELERFLASQEAHARPSSR